MKLKPLLGAGQWLGMGVGAKEHRWGLRDTRASPHFGKQIQGESHVGLREARGGSSRGLTVDPQTKAACLDGGREGGGGRSWEVRSPALPI